MNFEFYLDHLRNNRRCTEQTIKSYRSDLKMFGDFLTDRSLTQISQVNHIVVTEYISHMREKANPRFDRAGLTDSTIARRLTSLSGYFDFLRATTEPSLRNPLKGGLRKWKKRREPKPVDELTLDLLLASITSLRDRALFNLFLASGLRIDEMHQLNRDSITIELEVTVTGEERLIGTGEVLGKGRKLRKFFIDEHAIEIYAEYLASRTDDSPALFLSERKQRMSVRAMQERLSSWCKKLGFSHLNVHRLRHTYATRLANSGMGTRS